jgi:hypothetical protein
MVGAVWELLSLNSEALNLSRHNFCKIVPLVNEQETGQSEPKQKSQVAAVDFEDSRIC